MDSQEQQEPPRKKIAVIGELHRDLFYRTTMYAELIDALTTMIEDLPRTGLAHGDLRQRVKEVFLDSPKKNPGTASITRGGNGNNSATLLARLGLPVQLVTAVGTGVEWMRPELHALGIDDRYVFTLEAPTPISCILEDPEVTKIVVAPNLKRAMNFDSVEIPEAAFTGACMAFFTPMARKYAGLLARFTRAGIYRAFTLETQKITTVEELRACVPETVDLMFANLDDARQVAEFEGDVTPGALEPLTALDEEYRAFAHARVYTWGRHGSVVCADALEPIHVPVVEVTVKDRTGAGDTYAAGFLARLFDTLATGQSLAALDPEAKASLYASAARHASLAAAFKVHTGNAPAREELDAFAARQ